jgi:hypothetical protein
VYGPRQQLTWYTIGDLAPVVVDHDLVTAQTGAPELQEQSSRSSRRVMLINPSAVP